ncbi:MAG: sugar ABC transporter permease [Ruthenibacterium sp.]
MSKRKIAPYLYLLPGVLLLLIFVYYPIAQNIGYSFLKWDLFTNVKTNVGLSNYIKLLQSDEFWVALKNNLWYVVISLACQVGVALVLAAFLENMKSKKLSAIFRTTYFLPSLISLTVIGLLFSFIYKTDGLLNSLLEALRLGQFATGWLGNETTAIFAVIAVSQWKSIGYTMMLLIVAIQKIPTDLNEAACIDGASKIQTFFHITVPNIAGMLKIAMVINISGGLLVFNEVFIMTAGGPYGSSEVLSTLMYQNAFVYGKVGYASAIANIILVLSVVFSSLQFASFERKPSKKRCKEIKQSIGRCKR